MAKKIDLDGLEFFKGKENAMVADEYSSSKIYALGAYAYHAGTLYKCTTAITTAEAWTAEHWTAAKLADDVTSQSEKIDDTTDYVLTGNLLPTYLFSSNFQTSATTDLASKSITVTSTGTGTYTGYSTPSNTLKTILIPNHKYRLSFEATVDVKSGNPFVQVGVRGTSEDSGRIAVRTGSGYDTPVGTYSMEFTATEYMSYVTLFVSWESSAKNSKITYSNIRLQEIVELSANDKKARAVTESLPRYTKMFPLKKGFYKSTLEYSLNNDWFCTKIDLSDFDTTTDLLITHGKRFNAYNSGGVIIPTVIFTDSSDNVVYYILTNSIGQDSALQVGVPNGAKYIYLNFTASQGIGEYCAISNYLKPISNTVKLAASDSSVVAKNDSDFVCTGQNDEVLINEIINIYAYNGNGLTLELKKGKYSIDSFPNYSLSDGAYSAIVVLQSIKNFTIKGEDFASPTDMVEIVVSDTCYESLDASTQYKILRGSYVEDAYASTLHMQVKNISFRMPWNQKKVMFLDMLYSTSVWIEKVYCRAFRSGYDGHTVDVSHPPAVAVEGCIGIRATHGSNNGVVNNYISIDAVGFYEGFKLAGEHLVGINLSAIFCVYGYTFGNYAWADASIHPITLINCCDERNVNLPLFVANGQYDSESHSGSQAITFIDFNIERFDSVVPGGTLGDYATETYPNAFRGTINYTIQTDSDSNAVDVQFWDYGSGNGIKSRNDAQLLACDTTTRLTYAPNYLQRIFDTTLGKEVICIDPENGTWVDASGNSV